MHAHVRGGQQFGSFIYKSNLHLRVLHRPVRSLVAHCRYSSEGRTCGEVHTGRKIQGSQLARHWRSSSEMAISREAIVFVVVSCIVATVAGFGEDGLPRPTNFPDTPTTWFGPEPLIMTPDGKFVDCSWYGFANEQYDASVGEKCLDDLWAGLTNATADVTLEPFVYYFSAGPTGSDPATLEPYCYEGCFNMDTGALAPDSGLFPPSVAPAPGPDCYIRGPTLAPYYWPGTPPSAVTPPPTAGA